MDTDALTLALVNHALIHGANADWAWAKAAELAERGGSVRALADEIRETVPLSQFV